MPALATGRKVKIARRAIGNILSGRPVTVSFELTYNCNANCEHCDLGPYVEEPRLGPDEFGRWIVDLKPVVAQISGGEPLLRKDLLDIVREMRRRDPVAIFVITTNAQLMDEDKYFELREAGIDQFSLSLDYPDDRHNRFRHLKRNFERISELSSGLARYGNNDIILACVVQSDNFRDLPRIAELARQWGVAVNFSTYNALRTGKREYLVTSKEDLAELGRVVDRLISMQSEGYPILTCGWTLREMIRFFESGRRPGCQAGKRFLIVNPWARLTPCGMFRDSYESRAHLAREFSASNRCDECFTAIRANSEKSPYRLFTGALRAVRRH